MAVSAFTVANIKPALGIDASQRFIFGLEALPEPLGSLKIDNNFTPVIGTPSQTNYEVRNKAFSGYRWIHTTTSTDTYGSLKLQRFLAASPTGVDIMTFNNDGTAIIPGVHDPKYIIQTVNASLPNAQSLGALTTGILKNTVTTGTGVLSTAVAGTDYATLGNRLDQFAVPTTSLNLNSQKIINLLNPTNPQDAATMAYVDNAIDNNFGPEVGLPFVQLNWNWANPGAQTPYLFYHKLNDAFTTKTLTKRIVADDASTPNRRWWGEDWGIGVSVPGTNNYATYSWGFSPSNSAGPIAHSTVYSVTFNSSTGSFLAMGMPISMNNWRITNVGTPLAFTDAANRQYVLDQISLGTVTLTGAVTGNGLVNGSFATSFSNSQSVSGDTQTFTYSNALTTSIFALQNTNASALTRFRAGSSTDYLETGYDGATDYSYFNLVGGSNDRFAFRIGGTGVAALTIASLFGVGTVSPTQARIVAQGGVTNVGSEESCIRAISGSTSAKIEIQNTTASTGKIYELRSNSTGTFDITDRTGGSTRVTLSSAGNVGIGTASPNALFQLSNATASRKIVIFESANNDHQVKGLGHDSNVFRFQTNTTTDSFVFFAGTSSSTSNEVGRLSGTGDFAISDTFYGRRPSGTCYMQANATATAVTAATWTKVAGTTSAVMNKFTMAANNRLQYTDTRTIVAFVVVSVTAQHDIILGAILGFSIFKNGVQVVPSAMFNSDGLNEARNTSLTTIVSLSTNDYLEVFCQSSATGNITVGYLTMDVTTT